MYAKLEPVKKILAVIFIPLIFLTISIFTLKDYGVSWDEPIHFYRGQAYLHYFLTGKKNFDDLPRLIEYMPRFQGYSLPKDGKFSTGSSTSRVSYYQNIDLDFEYWLINDGGHPVINDELSALTNFVFYQKLGIMDDIPAHHLFNVLTSTILVLVVSVFAYKSYGLLASLISAMVMVTYPLFFAESKFNIKDPPQAAFYTLCIFAFWISLKKGSWKWLLLSVISFAFSFGMKFNILFLPFILIPYLMIRYWQDIKKGLKQLKKVPLSYYLVILFSPIIIGIIFFGSWPFLWSDPIGNFAKVFSYYKDIGIGSDYPGYYIGKFNLYPIIWILISTSPVVLVLLLFGIVALFKVKDKEKTPLLWLLLFVVPIGRVTIPGASIYGGIRQIMEFLPAMALLCGFGLDWFLQMVKIKSINIKTFVILILSIFLFIPLFKYHPNENVYFNFFVGGLSGAKAKNIPYWGNSFGNVYWQLIQWLNKNGEQSSHLALVQATGLSMPRIMLRHDIEYWNGYWSGIDRKGEYLAELTYGGVRAAYPYAWDYVENFLEPVYEVKVDGVAIAKLWKNDLEHTKKEMKNKKEVKYLNPVISIKDNLIISELREVNILNRIVINYKNDSNCVIRGGVQTSLDLVKWHPETEGIPADQIIERKMVDKGVVTFYFPGREAKGIKIIPDSKNSCLLNKPIVEIFTLE